MDVKLDFVASDNQNKHTAIFTNSMGAGGSERMVSILLDYAYQNSIKPYVINLHKDNFYSLPKDVHIHYLEEDKKFDSSLTKFFGLFTAALKLKRYLKDNNITFVQSHVYRSNFINILAKLFGSRHKVQIVETMDIDFFRQRRIELFMISFFYKFADSFIFKSRLMAYKMEQFLGKKVDNLVAYNGYDIELIENAANEEVDDFIFAPDKKYIISVGRLEKQKNHALLMATFAKLDCKDVALIILGEGSEKVPLFELCKKLDIENKVFFLGVKQNPFKYIKACDIFVLSSDYEGFPNILAEAMICKTTIISTDCPSGPRELLAPNTDFMHVLNGHLEIASNGILVPVNNEYLMLQALKMLLQDSNLADKFVGNARAYVDRFAKNIVCAKYLSRFS